MSHEVTIPAEATDAMRVLDATFGSELAAVYLHGSAVGGGLQPNSDVDLLAIVDAPLSQHTCQGLLSALMEVSGRYPIAANGRRPLELMIFLRAALAGFVHPVRGEFVYGEWLRAEFEAGILPVPTVNPDFTLLLAQVRQQGIALAGPPPTELLPAIGAADIRLAIAGALPELMGSLAGDERNVLLTLARMWFTLATGEFTTKDAAAQWAMQHLPGEAAALLGTARDAYLGMAEDDLASRQSEAARAAQVLSARVSGAL